MDKCDACVDNIRCDKCKQLKELLINGIDHPNPLCEFCDIIDRQWCVSCLRHRRRIRLRYTGMTSLGRKANF